MATPAEEKLMIAEPVEVPKWPDTRYLRSLEGIVRMITLPLAVVGVVLASVEYQGSGWLYVVTGSSLIIYIATVFLFEVCVPNIYIHRLVDGLVMFCYTGLWVASTVIAMVYAIQEDSAALGAASFFGIACAALSLLSASLAIRAWKVNKSGTRGSQALFLICF